jgi:hypothetical protein
MIKDLKMGINLPEAGPKGRTPGNFLSSLDAFIL